MMRFRGRGVDCCLFVLPLVYLPPKTLTASLVAHRALSMGTFLVGKGMNSWSEEGAVVRGAGSCGLFAIGS